MAQYHFPPIDMLNESRDVSTFTDIRYVEELKQKLNYMFAMFKMDVALRLIQIITLIPSC